MRRFYTLLFYLALPLLLIRLWWRSRHSSTYVARLKGYLGFSCPRFKHCIWIHAVSLGETKATIPLINLLKERYPHLPLLITTTTATGAAYVQKSLGNRVHHSYLPYDLPFAMGRFLRATNPLIAIMIETEWWPNLLHSCKQRKIPVCLLNARLSAKSAAGYRRIPSLTHAMLHPIELIAAQGEKDAGRFIALGAIKERVLVTGNVKFDLSLPANLAEETAQLRERLGRERFIWIAASTHEGEEEIILAAHKKLREQNPRALLILVPRHPERFAHVAALSTRYFPTVRRSTKTPCVAETAVYLGDTLGELLLLYGAADVTFVGGSLIPHGGHNILEPGALGKPILSGPHLFNFAEISELFLAANALIHITNQESLVSQLKDLMQENTKRETMGKSALEVIAANRGALARQAALIEKILALRMVTTV